jgi:hypothetical protein
MIRQYSFHELMHRLKSGKWSVIHDGAERYYFFRLSEQP